MMKNILLLLVSLCCCVHIYAQHKEVQPDFCQSLDTFRGNKVCRISKGTCKNAIKVLRAAFENDSLAVEVFKQEYEITNMYRLDKEQLSEMGYSEIIRFFDAKQNESYKCVLKKFQYYQPILLIR